MGLKPATGRLCLLQPCSSGQWRATIWRRSGASLAKQPRNPELRNFSADRGAFSRVVPWSSLHSLALHLIQTIHMDCTPIPYEIEETRLRESRSKESSALCLGKSELWTRRGSLALESADQTLRRGPRAQILRSLPASELSLSMICPRKIDRPLAKRV